MEIDEDYNPDDELYVIGGTSSKDQVLVFFFFQHSNRSNNVSSFRKLKLKFTIVDKKLLKIYNQLKSQLCDRFIQHAIYEDPRKY